MKKYIGNIKMDILIYYTCMALFLCVAAVVDAASDSNVISSKIINHELRLTKDGAGDYMITSVPQELREEIDNMGRIGGVSAVFLSRQDGKWDPVPLIGSRYPHNHPLIKEAIRHLYLFMDICDKVVPDEKALSLGYYVDYNEIIIFLDPSTWQNKTHYEEVIKKLNDGMLGEAV